MFRLVEQIQVGTYRFRSIVESEINQSFESVSDTAVIKFPNVLYRDTNDPVFIDSENLTSLIKRGDPVRIWHGYDTPYDNLELKFEGFVNYIDPDDVLKVHCEDYGFVLKNKEVKTQKIKDATIRGLVETVMGGLDIEINYLDENADIGDWQIDNNSYVNVTMVLDKLRSNFGVYSYFRGRVLQVGRITDNTGVEHTFLMEANVIGDDLTYRADNELSLVVRAIAKNDDNEKVERYAFLQDGELKLSSSGIPGETRTLNFVNKTAAELDDILTKNFNKYVYVGYFGNFTTFLAPNVNHGDYVNLFSLKFPEKNSQYRVKSVSKKTSDKGGRQMIELDYKIKDLNNIRIGV